MNRVDRLARDPAALERLLKRAEQNLRKWEARVELFRQLLPLARRGQLKTSEHAGNVDTMDELAHALASSAGKSKDPLTKAANKAGYSLRMLAKDPRVDMSASALSMARIPRGIKNSRPIPESKCLAIEALTGFRAVEANWPAGIIRGR